MYDNLMAHFFDKYEVAAHLEWDDFMTDIKMLPQTFPVLVYYYAPLKPYKWRHLADFPYYDSVSGPAKNRRPGLYKRSSLASSYLPSQVPELGKPFLGVLTAFWEFHTFSMFIKYLSRDDIERMVFPLGRDSRQNFYSPGVEFFEAETERR